MASSSLDDRGCDQVSLVPSKPAVLPALGGLRFLAIAHLVLFHLFEAHRGGMLRFPVLDRLPWPLARLLACGFVSTGLFFVLSGFILTYNYLGEDGRLRVAARGFWRSRAARLYPLYAATLLATAPVFFPMVVSAGAPRTTLVGASVASVLLLQSWIPDWALWWNAPAWALSALAFLYLVFPILGPRIARLGPRPLVGLLIGLWAAALAPAAAYHLLDPDGLGGGVSPQSRGFWLHALKFHPLSWLPTFAAGIALAVHRTRRPGRGVPSGVALAALAAVVLASERIPYVVLRHGLTLPLALALVRSLAAGEGPVARFLSARALRTLGEASFGIYLLQMPVVIWFAVLVLAPDFEGSGAMLALILTAIVVLALASRRWLETPLARRLARRNSLADKDLGCSREAGVRIHGPGRSSP